MVHDFLAIGYDPSFIRENGDSPMHFAINSTKPCIIRAITKDFSISIKNKDGHSPLAVTILCKNDVAVDIWWRLAADRNILNNNDDTLLHLACRDKSYDIGMQIERAQYSRTNLFTYRMRGRPSNGPVCIASLQSGQRWFDTTTNLIFFFCMTVLPGPVYRQYRILLMFKKELTMSTTTCCQKCLFGVNKIGGVSSFP